MSRERFLSFSSLTQRAVYTTNAVFALAASNDTRGAALYGVQSLAAASLYSLRLLYDPGTGTSSLTYGPGTSAVFHGLDKRVALVVMSALDCAAMLAFLLLLLVIKLRLHRMERKVDRDTLSLDDYTVVVKGLPRDLVRKEDVEAHIVAVCPALRGAVAQVFVGKAFGLLLERLQKKGRALEAVEALDAYAASTHSKQKLAAKRAQLINRAKEVDAELFAIKGSCPMSLPSCTDDARCAFDACSTHHVGAPGWI